MRRIRFLPSTPVDRWHAINEHRSNLCAAIVAADPVAVRRHLAAAHRCDLVHAVLRSNATPIPHGKLAVAAPFRKSHLLHVAAVGAGVAHTTDADRRLAEVVGLLFRADRTAGRLMATSDEKGVRAFALNFAFLAGRWPSAVTLLAHGAWSARMDPAAVHPRVMEMLRALRMDGALLQPRFAEIAFFGPPALWCVVLDHECGHPMAETAAAFLCRHLDKPLSLGNGWRLKRPDHTHSNPLRPTVVRSLDLLDVDRGRLAAARRIGGCTDWTPSLMEGLVRRSLLSGLWHPTTARLWPQADRAWTRALWTAVLIRDRRAHMSTRRRPCNLPAELWCIITTFALGLRRAAAGCAR